MGIRVWVWQTDHAEVTILQALGSNRARGAGEEAKFMENMVTGTKRPPTQPHHEPAFFLQTPPTRR